MYGLWTSHAPVGCSIHLRRSADKAAGQSRGQRSGGDDVIDFGNDDDHHAPPAIDVMMSMNDCRPDRIAVNISRAGIACLLRKGKDKSYCVKGAGPAIVGADPPRTVVNHAKTTQRMVQKMSENLAPIRRLPIKKELSS